MKFTSPSSSESMHRIDVGSGHGNKAEFAAALENNFEVRWSQNLIYIIPFPHESKIF
jgi:hypothetical protein